MNKRQHNTIIILISFGLYFILDEIYFGELRSRINDFIGQIGLSHIITYLLMGLPLLLGYLLIHKKPFDFMGSIDFNKMLTAIRFSLVCTAPMFIGYAVFFNFNSNLSLNNILISVIAAALFEELFYRGYLFGQLFRHTAFGFIPSAIIGALLFGVVHLYQGNSLTECMGVFAITFAGAVLYAWVYSEKNFNLWVPVFLHLFMNLSWDMFDAGDNAMGGVISNIFRIITIALIIILTLRLKKTKQESLNVNRRSLWRHR